MDEADIVSGLPMSMTYEQVIHELRARADARVVAGMARAGINPRGTLGIQVTALQKLARVIGTDHELAAALWASGIHEARILAALVDDPEQVTEDQMDHWAFAFNSWDVCDQVCKYLFSRTPYAVEKIRQWASHNGQFVKRAAFALVADLAASDNTASDTLFEEFLVLAEREAIDDRNYVKKAVSWAIRQIGKRNESLRAAALRTAQRLSQQGSPGALWIAQDVMNELGVAKAERPRGRGRRSKDGEHAVSSPEGEA